MEQRVLFEGMFLLTLAYDMTNLQAHRNIIHPMQKFRHL